MIVIHGGTQFNSLLSVVGKCKKNCVPQKFKIQNGEIHFKCYHIIFLHPETQNIGIMEGFWLRHSYLSKNNKKTDKCQKKNVPRQNVISY